MVCSPEIADHQRYPLVALVPLTGTPGEELLYPRLQPGRSGLRKASRALIDQIRSLDKRRVLQLFARISDEEPGSIDEGLRLLLDLRGGLAGL